MKQKIYDRSAYQKCIFFNGKIKLITLFPGISHWTSPQPDEFIRKVTPISLRCNLISSLPASLWCSNDIFAAHFLKTYMNFSFFQCLLYSPHITCH